MVFHQFLWNFKGILWCFLTIAMELYSCAWRLNVSWFCWDLQYWYWLEFLCNSWIYMIVNKGWKIIYLLCKLMPELFYLKTKVVLMLWRDFWSCKTIITWELYLLLLLLHHFYVIIAKSMGLFAWQMRSYLKYIMYCFWFQCSVWSMSQYDFWKYDFAFVTRMVLFHIVRNHGTVHMKKKFLHWLAWF